LVKANTIWHAMCMDVSVKYIFLADIHFGRCILGFVLD
jgi:hypothetical protein